MFLGIRRMLSFTRLPTARTQAKTRVRVGGWGGVEWRWTGGSSGGGRGLVEVGNDDGWTLLGTTIHAKNLICNFCNPVSPPKNLFALLSCWKKQGTAVNLPDGGFHSRSETILDG